MGEAAESQWAQAPIYRPPDARHEWEEPVRRPVNRAPVVVRPRGVFRVDAARAEDALEDVAVAGATQALALRRRLNRAATQATRAAERRRRQTAQRAEELAQQRAEMEAARLEAERAAQMARQEAARAAVRERLRVESERLAAERAAVEERARREAEALEQAQAAALEVARLAEERARLAEERARSELLAREAEREQALREAALREEGRRRIAAANTLDRTAALLREYEGWARSRGLAGVAAAGLSTEADRLEHEVAHLRYG